jgi:hypothetical protein
MYFTSLALHEHLGLVGLGMKDEGMSSAGKPVADAAPTPAPATTPKKR